MSATFKNIRADHTDITVRQDQALLNSKSYVELLLDRETFISTHWIQMSN